MAKFVEIGYGVLKPLGDNLRYDLAIEDTDGKLWKIQCKTGRSKGEYIEFKTVSYYYHTRAGRTTNGHKSYHGQIDYFAVYCRETKGVYLVPVDETGTSQIILHLTATKNNQEKNVRWAKDYEL